jgi:succinate dehydrogenase/fumarate reductase flavoprotein subunit
MGEPTLERKQIDDEKARVYRPVNQKGEIGWKELQAGVCRIMQDYCGEYRGEEALRMGLWWLNDIRESEAQRTYIRNPHELARYLECMVRITNGEIMMHASLARQASSQILDFKRIDYPEMDPLEWMKFITVKQEKGDVTTGERPLNYWLLPPYKPTYEENYRDHCMLL